MSGEMSSLPFFQPRDVEAVNTTHRGEIGRHDTKRAVLVQGGMEASRLLCGDRVDGEVEPAVPNDAIDDVFTFIMLVMNVALILSVTVSMPSMTMATGAHCFKRGRA